MAGTAPLKRLATAVGSCGALLALAWLIDGRSLEILPGSDDLYNFEWAGRVSAAAALRGEPAFYPEWRPLSALAVWLQYRWSGLDHIPAYFVVNILLWTACGWVIWRLVTTQTDSPAAGLLAGSVVLADARSVSTISWIVERQMSLACLFGLLALSLVARDRREAMTWLEWAGLSLLLMASALSKEFGLAFAIAIAVAAWRGPNTGAASAAIVAIVAYAGLRVGLAGGAISRVCEEMGYFFSTRPVCFVPVDRTAVTQATYNVAAALLDSVLAGFLTGDGRMAVAPLRLPASAAWLALAAIGWAKGPRIVRVAALVLAANVALNFMFYRDRNHLIGLCAVAIAAGVGWATADRMLATRPYPRATRALALAFVLGLLTVQIVQTRRVVASVVEETLQHDPCEALVDFPQIPAGLVKQLKTQYGLNNPDCVTGR